jgi:aldose 1-epimerase
MVHPSGEQYEIGAGGYRAVVTEGGAGLRLLEHDGRPLLLGWPEDQQTASGRGQLLAPWPNRIRDGKYGFDDRDLQLPLSEPARRNATHGLVRWASWTLEEQTPQSVSLVLRLMSQTGYPWTLDLHVLYDVSAAGLTVTITATNLSASRAPYALGAHPYLTTGTGPVDDWELTLPCDTRLLTDDRMIPTGREPVAGTDFDFREARTIGATSLDTAFTGLTRDEQGVASVVVRDPRSGDGTVLWMDASHSWVQVFTGDELPAHARESLAVEPMTSPPIAFATGEDLVVLAPAGQDGDEHSCSWGLHAL